MLIQWELLIFSFLVGISAGIFVFIGIGEAKGMFQSTRMTAALISLVTLILGGLASFLHLGHPERIFHILGNVGSGIAQELIFTTLMGIVIVAYIFSLKKGTAAMQKMIGMVGAVYALVIPFSTGKIYLLAARPAWDTIMLPLMYVAAALAMGFFIMWLVTLKKGEVEETRFANQLAIGGEGAFALMVVGYLAAIAAAPYQHANRSVMRLLTGDLAILFWVGVVCIGLLLPLFIALRSYKAVAPTSVQATADGSQAGAVSGQNTGMIMMATVNVLVGSVIIRMLMYMMGSSIEQFFI